MSVESVPCFVVSQVVSRCESTAPKGFDADPEEAGSDARSAGINVSSMASDERMPSAVNVPKRCMEAVLKVIRERKETAAMSEDAIVAIPVVSSARMIASSGESASWVSS